MFGGGVVDGFDHGPLRVLAHLLRSRSERGGASTAPTMVGRRLWMVALGAMLLV